MYNNIETSLEIRSYLGEGIIWVDGQLYWIDIMKGEIHRFDVKSGKDTYMKTGGYTGFIVPKRGGGLIAGVGTGLFDVDFDNKKLTPVFTLENEPENTRFNDGKCDPAGRIWAGTMSNEYNEASSGRNCGTLYRIEPDFRCEPVLTGLAISNGMAFNADGTLMYHIDTMTQCVHEYGYSMKTGKLGGGREAVRIKPECGSPDGMTIDSEGMLWVARWEGYGISRYEPKTGRELCRIDIPALNVTSAAFGGDKLDELYITTSAIDADLEKYPLSGSIFVARPGVCGVEINKFGKE